MMSVEDRSTVRHVARRTAAARIGAAVSMAGIITSLFGVGGFAIGARLAPRQLVHVAPAHRRLILDHGIPRHDPYSFTAAGTHWIAQSWLAELMYGVVSTGRSARSGIRIAVGLARRVASRSFLFRVALHATDDRVRALALGDPRARVHFSTCGPSGR